MNQTSQEKLGSKSKSPLSVVFPPEAGLLQQTKNLVADTEKRQDASAKIAEQDPALVIELLRAGNALAVSEGKPPVTTVRTAIIRLGASSVVDRLEKLSDVPRFEVKEVADWFEISRDRCRRTGAVAGIIAGVLANSLAEDCRTSAVLYGIGDLVAVAHLGADYAELAANNSRAKLLYRLEKDFNFDVHKMGISYLKRAGMPEIVLYGIDPDTQTKAPGKEIMKPLCASAAELVSNFDLEKWDKVAPGAKLPAKSSLRLLKMSDSQYETIYEEVGRYLHAQNSEARAAE